MLVGPPPRSWPALGDNLHDFPSRREIVEQLEAIVKSLNAINISQVTLVTLVSKIGAQLQTLLTLRNKDNNCYANY